MLAVYRLGLDFVLRHQPATLIATAATLALTGALAALIPKGFFPVQDTGLALGVTQAAPDVSFPRMLRLQERLIEIVRADPDVETVTSFIGADGTNPTTNSSRLSLSLKPRSKRTADAAQVLERLQKRFAEVEGIEVYQQLVQDLQIDSRISRTQYQCTLEDADPEELAEWAPKLEQRLRALPRLRNVASDLQTNGLQLSLTIDRDTAARLGVAPQAIDDVLNDAFGQRQVSTIFTQLNQYRVILEIKPELQSSARGIAPGRRGKRNGPFARRRRVREVRAERAWGFLGVRPSPCSEPNLVPTYTTPVVLNRPNRGDCENPRRQPRAAPR